MPTIEDAFFSDDSRIRIAAVFAFGKIAQDEDVESLSEPFDDHVLEVQMATVKALEEIGTAQAREMLELAVSSSEPEVQLLAQAALDALKADDELIYAVSPAMIERGLFGVPASARGTGRDLGRYDAPTEEGWANVTPEGSRGGCSESAGRHRRRLRRLFGIGRVLQRLEYELSAGRAKISASLLSADFGYLADSIKSAERAGVDEFHFDVMDGHFVPNLTFGPPILEAVKRHATKPIDVHVMERSPEHLLPVYASAGGDIITIHIEGVADVDETIDVILEAGAQPAVAVRPRTPVSALRTIADRVKRILVMTVEPGFGGQEFCLILCPRSMRRCR